MIAARMGQTSDDGDGDTGKLAQAIRRLASAATRSYGDWHVFDTTSDAVSAVVAEIGETVLARRVRVTVQESGATLDLIISNRHLVAIEGANVDCEGAEATEVLVALNNALSGSVCLMFEVVGRNPVLPSSARSWSFKALSDALGEDALSGSVENDLNLRLKSIASAWLRHTYGGEASSHAGDAEQVGQLRNLSAHWAKKRAQSAKWRSDKAQLTILPTVDRHMVVMIEQGADVLWALCPHETKAQLLELWRQAQA